MERFAMMTRWRRMMSFVLLGLAGIGIFEAGASGRRVHAGQTPTLLVVVGAGGTEEYAAAFADWARQWQERAEQAGCDYHQIGPADTADSVSDRQRLREWLENDGRKASTPLWLVLIGHGTWFQDVARFNLTGPDITARELAEWLQPVQRPIVMINCTSSSAPFLPRLSGPERIVVTATRDGAEQNYTRFGGFLVQALGDSAADLDHDGQVSLLEAFLAASGRVEQYYTQQGRLATEHALLDDNGDGVGTPAEFFTGIHATKTARQQALPDGQFAHQQVLIFPPETLQLNEAQTAERNRIEDAIERLRQQKDALPAETYYQQLEPLLVELARLYESAENATIPAEAGESAGLAPAP